MKNSMIKIYGITSILFLSVLAISPLKDYFTEWRSYQSKYNQILERQPKRIHPVKIGLKEIWVQDLDRVDRCISCHLGVEEPGLEKGAQPFQTHPKIYHDDFQEFGCTICHGGQGLATTKEKAHGKVKFWDEPLIGNKYLDASCGKCHKTQEISDAPILTAGKKLISKYNCTGCHKIQNFTKQWVPSLNGIGSKVNRKWLIKWLKNPKDYFLDSIMPNFLLTDEDAAILADFLLTFKTSGVPMEPLAGKFIKPGSSEHDKLTALGKTKFSEARCISCHRINGKGGRRAIELGKIASKVNLQWLYHYVKDPKSIQPGVEMPRYRFTETELSAVALYMIDEFVDYEAPPDTVQAFVSTDPAFYEKGEKLFKKYNCSGCHDLQNVKKNEEMGPELTFIGSKKAYEIEFGKTETSREQSEYIFTKLKMPRIFTNNSKMPDYQFSDDEAVAITTALLSFTQDEIPSKYKILPKNHDPYRPQGEFGKLVHDLACFTCHQIYGTGGEIAPDLSMEGSQVREDWLKKYFKIPYSLRPILTERMPNLFLKENEINIISDYFQKVLLNDSLSLQGISQDNDKIAVGKQLYFEKYGCQSCHQINQQGGYVGPPLDHLGTRLNPGWIYHWLKDPQKYKPGTIEPNNGLTDEEAKTLTLYLLSLK